MIRPPQPYNPPSSDALIVLYSDDDLIVADKPSGLLSVPGIGTEKSVCAISILAERYGSVFTVHRLDMDTSGVMVIARNKDTQRALSKQFEQRRVGKTYEALVQGSTQSEHGTIDAAIARHSNNRPLRHLDPNGRSAITHWSVIAREGTTTRLSLTPETGRSHQIRLHLASSGHPILGDGFYGDPSSHSRLCLHAVRLKFVHPGSGKDVLISSPAPF